MSASIDTPTREDLKTVPNRMWGKPYRAPTPSGRVGDNGWLVVHSHPKAEHWASTELRRRGYSPYLPLMTVRQRDRVVRSLWHTVQRPLFSRYLFVADPGHWTPIRYCPGVHQVVMMSGKPSIAANAAISALQAAEAVRATLPAPNRQWAPGTPCVVGNGTFDDVPAVVLRVGTEMALVAMMWFGALREVAVQLDCLKSRDE